MLSETRSWLREMAGRARVGVVQVWHETNTYSPRLTGLEQFIEHEYALGEEILERHRGARSVVGGFIDEAAFDPVPILTARAWPSAPADRPAINEILDQLRAQLAHAPPLDGVLVDLHGAMVADGCPDVERGVLEIVREEVGDVPLACVLDLHAIPSPEFVELADVVLAYETYPHVDMYERGREAAGLLTEMLAGRRLVTALAKVPILTSPLAQATDAEPMLRLGQKASELSERVGGRIFLLPGFPYSDQERAGFSIIGVADEGGSAGLQSALAELAAVVETAAPEFRLERDTPEGAVARALQETFRPVVLVDVADNVGGGSAGDGTALLAELLRQDARDAIVTLADADVAIAAGEAGEGARLQATMGAKLDDRHGVPVDVDAVVLRVTDGGYRAGGQYMTGLEFSMGRSALLAVGDLKVIVTERAVPPFHREQVTSMGLEPGEASVITAKGAVAWRTAFGDVAARVIEVDTPGVTPLDPAVLPRTTRPMRHVPGVDRA